MLTFALGLSLPDEIDDKSSSSSLYETEGYYFFGWTITNFFASFTLRSYNYLYFFCIWKILEWLIRISNEFFTILWDFKDYLRTIEL